MPLSSAAVCQELGLRDRLGFSCGMSRAISGTLTIFCSILDSKEAP